jgi:hypothetical protein
VWGVGCRSHGAPDDIRMNSVECSFWSPALSRENIFWSVRTYCTVPSCTYITYGRG